MSTYNESGVRAFPCATAIPRGYAVKFSSGNIVVATAATDAIIGVMDVASASTDGKANVRLRSASGTSIGVAGTGGVAVGNRVTAESDGQLVATTTDGDEIVGIALTAASAGGEFEFMNSTGEVAAAA